MNPINGPYFKGVFTTLFLFAISYNTPLFVSAQNIKEYPAQFSNSRIIIDGHIDEEAWQNTKPIEGFYQLEPVEGSPSAKSTEVRIIFGENSLYIAAILNDDPTLIEKSLGRRDEYNNADWFMVSVDSRYSRKEAFTFGVNAAGVQLDGQLRSSLTADGNLIKALDISWNAIWHSATRTSDEGWIVEIEIPFSMLRFSGNENQTWGIHFTRRIARLGEVSEWPLVPKMERSNFVAQFGQLTNINRIALGNKIQIHPYLLAGLNNTDNAVDGSNPRYRGNFNFGSDLKLGIGTGIMLDASINPDFGQVESDPAVLNLTAFETRLTENRPFFMEGAEIFQFGIGQSQLFHSRRIGMKNPVIGAVKISGRSARRLSFGLLGASEGRNFNPSGNYGVGRLSQQLGQYSSVGAIFTSFYTPEASASGWNSNTGGINWDVRNKNNTFSFEGIAAFSNRNSVTGDHPDETGIMGGVVFRKRQGIINGHLTFLAFSDQYNPNDLGWTTFERDFRNSWANITYNINKGQSFGPFHRAFLTYYHNQRFSYVDWLNIGDINRISSEWITRSFRTLKLSGKFTNMFGGYDQFETRGLGIWARPENIEFAGEYMSDERKNWKIIHEGVFAVVENGGRQYGYKLTGRIDFGSRLSITGIMDTKMDNGVTAWVSNETFAKSSDTWLIGTNSIPPGLLNPNDYEAFNDMGQLNPLLQTMNPYSPDVYYVSIFGERDTRSVDFTVRGSMSLSRRLSLQIYNQILMAKGKYQNFSILQSPKNLVKFDAYPKKNEFSLNSMQLNMVLRWEYHAGSTLYLIWSQGRSQRDDMNPLAPWDTSPYRIPIDHQIINIFNSYPRNVFIIKFDYAFVS